MTSIRLLWLTRVALTLAALCFALPSQATYQVSVDTSSLGASTLSAAFDLVDGGPPANSVAISNFSMDGSLGAAISTGSVSGSLASIVTLDDSAFFSELYQPITSATGIAFYFEPSANGPDTGSLPDTFSFFLIDDLTGLPLFDTTDPTGSGALFTFEIDGSAGGLLNVYGPTDTNVLVRWSVTPITTGNSVPEPDSLALLGIGLASAVVLRRRQVLRC